MNLKELLNLDRAEMLPDAQRVCKQVSKRRGRKVRAVAFSLSACAVLVLVAVSLLTIWLRPQDPQNVILTESANIIQSIEPTRTGAAGMNLNSDLKVTTTKNVPPAELKARLIITPEQDFSVKKIGTQTYELRFEEDFSANALYTVTAMYEEHPVYRWAFQTETAFCVTGAYPANEKNVGLETPVEITFSHAAVTGFESAFSIMPQVQGTFEHYGRTWAFVPSEPLDEATLYTVTLQKGINGPDGTNLEEDYTFSFTTAAVDSYAYLLYRQNEAADTYLVNESPMAMVIYNETTIADASVKVYRLDDAKSYTDACRTYVKSGVVSPDIMKLAGETPHQQFTVRPALLKDFNGIYDHAAAIHYPEALPEGYYFAEITVGGRRLYQLLQSTTYSVYTISVDGQHTVWVNDPMEGTAMKNVPVKLEGYKDQTTDKQGLATFAGDVEQAAGRALLVGEGEYPYITFLNGDCADPTLAETGKYFTYISTNSRLFRNNDTVGLFGVILPRKADVKTPSKATLEWDFGTETYSVDLDKNGSFTLELPLANTARTSGGIRLMVGDICLDECYIDIADYELPKYYVNLESDRLAYLEGDTVQLTAYVTYMDGTPAPGIPLTIGEEVSGITDQAGTFTATVTAEGYNSTYYTDMLTPQVKWANCTLEDGTDAYYGDDTSYLVVTAPYLLGATYKDGSLTVTAHQINLTKTDQLDPDGLYSNETVELLRGAGADVALMGDLHKITYQKVQDGTTYDPINKKVLYSWKYEEQDEWVRTFEFSTEQGKASVDLPEKSNENTNYYVDIYLPDGSGTIQVYLTDRLYFNGGSRSYNLSTDRSTAKVGEQVELLVRDGVDNQAINSGSVLYTVVSERIADVFQSESSRLSIEFKKEYAPDICIYGAYFDGTHVYSLGFEYVTYDQSESVLTVQMEKDQLQYRPGDEVQLTFTVTDQEGDPVRSVLNIGVMDRALYLIGGGNLETPADGLFRHRSFSSTVYTTLSHREYDLPDYGFGEGGGDGESTRSDFEDTPYFDTVETDRNGKATVTFTLPDSITQWKVLARAVTTDVQWASEMFDLVATQGYFASVVMPETIKPTDDLAVGIKGDGIKADANATCEFTVGLTDRDGNQLQTLTATALKSQYAYLNFGTLEEGVYTLYIQSTCGALQDSLIRTLRVEQSQGTLWVHHQQAVGDGATLSLVPRKGTVTLTVVDEQKAFWQQAMARLHSGGDRVDQVLGRYLADRYYADGSFMNPETMDNAIILNYLNYDGIRLFSHSANGDLRLSAKLAAVAPEFCDTEILKGAFTQYLNNRYAARVDTVISYFGLAALGEPVLADLQNLCMTVTDFTAEECGYLALALAYCGDYDTAGYLFENHLKPLLTQENGLVYAPEEDLTGCCALLANRLNLEVSEGLIQYIVATDTETTLLHLELISYLRDHMVETVGENTVTISLGDGSNQTYRYDKTGSLVLFLDQKQAENIRVMNGNGNSYVSYAYMGNAADLAGLNTPTAFAGTEIPDSVLRGDLTTIQLYAVIPADFEGAMLDCTLPAGLRLVSGTVSWDKGSYEIGSSYNARQISTSLPTGTCTITLQVRGALPGRYVMEPITVTHTADPRHIATEETVFTVVT